MILDPRAPIDLDAPKEERLSFAYKLGVAAAFLAFGVSLLLVAGIVIALGLGLLVTIQFLADVLALQ